MAGAVLSVTVTIDGEEYTDLTAAVAGEDKSAEVELVDDYGLQSDGTGIVGDRLTVTYGADFGTPTNVSWYKNGKVVQTNSVGDGVNNGLSVSIAAGGRWGVGTYKVTITNTDGDMATTNEIVITDKEEAATITGFTLEDDYTDGTDITYSTDDDTVIATITMSKNYAGTFQIWKSTDTKYTSAIDSLTTSTAAPLATAAQAVNTASGITGINTPGWPGYPVDGASVLTTNQATNYQVVNAGNAGDATSIGSGYGYINTDGTVTYKFAVNTGIKTRGQDYVVTFNQDSISTDTPGTGTANKFDTAATVPYVKAIDHIAVTKVANGTAPQVTFYDVDGVATWFTGTASAITADGIADIEIYSATSKTNDVTKGTKLNVTDNTPNALLKGVWTSNVAAGNNAYWFAYIRTTAGIFAEKAAEIVSEAVPNAQDAATDIDLVESKTTASTAVVKFTNLRCAGTVYIARGRNIVTSTVNAGVITNAVAHDYTGLTNGASDIFEGFDPDDVNTYVTKIEVPVGSASIEVPNAIDKVTFGVTAANVPVNGVSTAVATHTTSNIAGTYYSNNYIAVFIPEDTTNYGQVYTNGAYSTDSYTSANGVASALTVRQELSKYTMNTLANNGAAGNDTDGNNQAAAFVGGTAYGNTKSAAVTQAATNTASVLNVLDQFGEKIDVSNTTTYDKTWTFKKVGSEGYQDALITLAYDCDNAGTAWAADGQAGARDDITLTVTNSGTAASPAAGMFVNGETYTATTSTGQTITLTVKNAAAGAVAAAGTDSTTVFAISIS